MECIFLEVNRQGNTLSMLIGVLFIYIDRLPVCGSSGCSS